MDSALIRSSTVTDVSQMGRKKHSKQRMQIEVPPAALAAWVANRALISAQQASAGSKHSRDSNYFTALDTDSARVVPPADKDTDSVNSDTSSGNERPNIQRRLSRGGDNISVASLETSSAHTIDALKTTVQNLQTIVENLTDKLT